MKSGNVILVGRPNAGKSTLLNALVKQKVSIISPKPQTTRRIIRAFWWDEENQIVFWDTPGIFGRVKDLIGKKINLMPAKALGSADLVVYLIDRSRKRGDEENRILGLVRKTDKPKVLVINKVDVYQPNYSHEYEFLKEEFNDWIEISALKKKNIKGLITKIIALLPEGKPLFDPKNLGPLPSDEITPEKFIADLIQEKLFLILRNELPYSTGVKVEEMKEKEKIFYIKAAIYTTGKKYKKMIIGKKASQIKEIGTLARKELELITDKPVYLDLNVIADPHWPEYLLD